MDKYQKLIAPLDDIDFAPSANGINQKLERSDEMLNKITPLKTLSQAKISKPMFQLFPTNIVFRDFEPHETYKASLVLRNNDMVPRQLRVVQNTVSPYFELIIPRAAGNNVAPGLTKTYKVHFTPNEKKDYFHELVCITERETFIIPIKAIGPRALLDFPDEIHFSVCTVKHSNTKTLLIRNIGSRDAVFSLTVDRPFFVTPERGTLDVDQSMQVTFSFTPETTNDIKSEVILHYDTGEDTKIMLFGAAQDSNVRLDKNTIRFENTYITTATQRTVTIQNRSNVIAYFRWTQYATQAEEEQQKMFQQACLSKMEKEETDLFVEECNVNPLLRDKMPIIGRMFKSMQQYVENNKLVFCDEILTLEPLEGEIWPNSSSDINIVFRPTEAQMYTRTAFCDITGRESRLPLCIRGYGKGPVVESSFSDINMGNIFIGSNHTYEIVLKNKGDLDAVFTVMETVSLFGPCFSFKPREGIIEPGSCQAIEVSFKSSNLGDFSEEFFFHVNGSLDPLLVTFTGSVIGPSFQFNVTKLMFGSVSYGFLNTRTCTLINTSLIPMTFHLRIPSDGVIQSVCSISNVNTNENRHNVGPVKEFEIIPVTDSLPPMSKTKITVNFISNTPKKYNVALVVDVEGFGEEILSLKISARCIVPYITILKSDLNYGHCFLHYPYEQIVELENNTDLPAKFELKPQKEIIGYENAPLRYYSPDPKGIIPPRKVCKMPLLIEAKKHRDQHMTIYISIFGAPDRDLEVKVKFVGAGPVVSLDPIHVDWGVVPVLTDIPKIVVFTNESLIPAKFTAKMVKPNSVFRIEPSEGVIPAKDFLNVSLIAHMDDCVGFENEMEIDIVDSSRRRVSVKACGQGTTILFDPPLTSLIDLGHNFSNRPMRKVFKLTNMCRRQQYLLWTTEGYHIYKEKKKFLAYNPQDIKNKNVTPPKQSQPVFKLTPNRMDLGPGETIEMTLDGWVDSPQVIRERLLCHSVIGKQEGKYLIVKVDVTANCISPLLEFSTKCVYFRADTYGGKYMPPLVHNLVMCNMCYLPLTVEFSLQNPFQIILDDGELISYQEISLDVGSSYCMRLQFDHMYEGEFNIQCVDANLVVTYKEHPHIDYIALRGEVYYPEVLLEHTLVNFGCILNDTESTRYVNMINTSPMEVNYKWTFVIGDQPCVVVNRGLSPIVEAHEMEETFDVVKQGSSSNQLVYLDDCYLNQTSSDGTVINELSKNNMEEQEHILQSVELCQNIPDAPIEHQKTIVPGKKVPERTMEVKPPPDQEYQAATSAELEMVETQEMTKHVYNMEKCGIGKHEIGEVATQLIVNDDEPGFRIIKYNAADAALKSNDTLSDLLLRAYEIRKPVGIEQVFDILPLYGILSPDQTEQLTLTFFGHPDITAEVKAICEIAGGPTHELVLKGEASSVEYKFDTRNIDFGQQLYDKVITSDFTLYNMGKVGFHFITINTDPLLAKHPPPGVPILVPPSGFIEPYSQQKLTLKFLFGVPEKFHKIFLIQVAHFEPDVINLYGEGWFPRISLDLPRLIDDNNSFNSLLIKAKEALMAEVSIKEAITSRESIKISLVREMESGDLSVADFDDLPVKDGSTNRATQTILSHIQQSLQSKSLSKETQTDESDIERIKARDPALMRIDHMELHDKDLKAAHGKEARVKESHIKVSHVKEAHGKEGHGKEGHHKDARDKEGHSKELRHKKPKNIQGEESPIKQSMEVGTQTIVTRIKEAHEDKDSADKESHAKKSHGKKSHAKQSHGKEAKKSAPEDQQTKDSDESDSKDLHAKKTQAKDGKKSKKTPNKDLPTDEPQTKKSTKKSKDKKPKIKELSDDDLPTEESPPVEEDEMDPLTKGAQTSESDFKQFQSLESSTDESLTKSLLNFTIIKPSYSGKQKRRPSQVEDKKIQLPVPSDLEIQLEAERMAVTETELRLHQEAEDAMYLDGDSIPVDTTETGDGPKAPPDPRKSKKKTKPKICLPEYILDFGHVILGTVRSQVVHAVNTGTLSVSFHVESKHLNKYGFDVHLDKVRNLPPAPNSETVEFDINFDPRGANLSLGPVQKLLYISVANGPYVAVVLKANVSMPNMQLSDDKLNFDDVCCGECKIITIQLYNNHLISCEWSAEKHSKPQVSRRVSLFMKRVVQSEKSKLPNYEVNPQRGTLLAGQKTNIQVRFFPTEEKVYDQKIPIRMAQSSERLLLHCTGNGIEPRLIFDPTHIEFEGVLPNGTSHEREVIVRNPCNFPIEFYSLEFDSGYLEEERVLRMMKDYDKNNKMLLPLREPGEKLPIELLEYSDELIKKLEDEKQTTTEKLSGKPHSAEGGARHRRLSTSPRLPAKKHNFMTGIKHHWNESSPTKHHGSESSPTKHHGSESSSPKHHGSDSSSPKHHGSGSSTPRRRSISLLRAESAKHRLSSDDGLKTPEIDDEVKQNNVDSVGELEVSPVSAAIARHIGLELTPEIKATSSKRGIAVIIHGPRRCGKSETAERLSNKYNAAILNVDLVVMEAIHKAETPVAKRILENYLDFAFRSFEERKRQEPEMEEASNKQSGGHKAVKASGGRKMSIVQPSHSKHNPNKKGFVDVKLKDKGAVQHEVTHGSPPTLASIVSNCIRGWNIPEEDLVEVLAERIERDDCYLGVVFDGLNSVFAPNVLATANAILRTFKGRRFIFFVPLNQDPEIMKANEKYNLKEKQRLANLAHDEERMLLEEMDEDVYDALPEEEKQWNDKRLLYLKKHKNKRDYFKRLEMEEEERVRKLREDAELEAQLSREKENEGKPRRGKGKAKGGKQLQKPDLAHTSTDRLHGHLHDGEQGNIHPVRSNDTVDDKKRKCSKEAKILKLKETDLSTEESQLEQEREIELHLMKQFQAYEHTQKELYYLMEHWQRTTMQPNNSPYFSDKEDQIRVEKYCREVIESFGAEFPIPPPTEFSVVQYPEPRQAPMVPTYGGRYILSCSTPEEFSLGIDDKGKDDDEKSDIQHDHQTQVKSKARRRSPGVSLRPQSPPPSPVEQDDKNSLGIDDKGKDDDEKSDLQHDHQTQVKSKARRRSPGVSLRPQSPPPSPVEQDDKKSQDEYVEEELPFLEASPSRIKTKLPHKLVKKMKKPTVRPSIRVKSPNPGPGASKLVTVLTDMTPNMYRWIVQPNSDITLKIRFTSEELGVYMQTLNFETVGTKKLYQLYCSGVCAYPTISLDPTVVFPRVKKNKKQYEIVHKKYILATKIFEFGPLLACKSREKYKELNFPENVESLTIMNASPMPAEVNINFQSDNSGETFLIHPSQMLLEAGATGILNLWAYPKFCGRFEDSIVINVKGNPVQTSFNIACDGCIATLELDKKSFAFDKVLLHRKETRTIVLKNRTMLPVGWRMDGVDYLGDDFTASAYSGLVEPLSDYPLNLYFRAIKSVGCFKKSVKLQIFDVDNVLGIMSTELIQVTAESYDVSLDMHFSKGSNCSFDFGLLHVFEESKQTCTLKNKGKYPIIFSLVTEDKDPTNPDVVKFLSILPMKATMTSSDRPLTVTVTFKGEREVNIIEKPLIKCHVIDPSIGESGETIAKIPINVSVTTAFSKFSIIPEKVVNFGTQTSSAKKTRQFVIENIGLFDFKYTMSKKIDEVHQKTSGSRIDQPGDNEISTPEAIAEKLKQAELLRQNKLDIFKAPDDILLGLPGLGDKPKQLKDAQVSLQRIGGPEPLSLMSMGAPVINRSAARVDTANPFRLTQGVFSIFPAYGMINSNSQQTITVECFSDMLLGQFKEDIYIDITDRDPADHPQGILFSLVSEAWLPSINTVDVGAIFEEHRICKTLDVWQHLNHLECDGVYGEEERKFMFNNVLVGRTAKARLKISNNSKVTSDVIFTIKTMNVKDIQDVFEVQPTRATIPVHGYCHIIVTFTPPSMQRFAANFEAFVEGLVNAHDPHKSLTFELCGEGNLPRISIDKPTLRNKRGQPLFLFHKLLVGRSQKLPFTLFNDGTLPSKVLIHIMDPKSAFKLTSTEQAVSRTDSNVDSKAKTSSSTTSVVVHVDKTVTFDMVFSPTASERYESEIKMMVIDNQYENIVVRMVGEGYEDDITLDNIHSIINSSLIVDEEDGCLDDENIQATKPNLINFGDCYINEPKVLTFSMNNHSLTENMKFEWAENELVKFSPKVGHIRHGCTKDFSITFKSDAPNTVTEHQMCCTITKINYENPDENIDWDDRIRTLKWIDIALPTSPVYPVQTKTNKTGKDVPMAPASTIPSTVVSAGVSPRPIEPPFKKKVIETDPEPPYTIVAGSTRMVELLVSGVVDYCQYTCKEDNINFKDTLMFMTRVFKMKLKNTGEIKMDFKWQITMYDPTTHSESTRENATLIDSSYVPFTVEPEYGTVEAGDKAIITVKFSPLDVNNYEALLTCSIPNLESGDRGPVVTVTAHSSMPYCHFELEEAADNTTIRRSSENCISTPNYNPNLKVINFECVGIVPSSVRFDMLNPTKQTYRFEWVPVEESDPKKHVPFRCQYPVGEIESNRKFQAAFEFVPIGIEVVKSYWTFLIPEKSIRVNFLLIGSVIEPDIMMDRSHLSFFALIGRETTGTVYLINNEELPFKYAFEEASCHTDGMSSDIEIQPMRGTLPPKSKSALELRFCPNSDKKLNFNLVCNVATKPKPVTLNVKAEGFALSAMVQYEHFLGDMEELSALNLSILNFGETEINEEVVRNFHITNTCKYMFDYQFELPDKVTKKNVVVVEPSKGKVSVGNTEICQIRFCPSAPISLKCEMFLKIWNGPTYNLIVRGLGKTPSLHFSFLSHKFGPCFIHQAGMPITSVTLVIANRDTKEISLDCLYESTQHLHHNFKSGIIKAYNTKEVTFVFYPREAIKYHDTVNFEINGLTKQAIEFYGQGTELKVEVVDLKHKMVNIGPRMIGDNVKKVIPIVNKSLASLTFKVDVTHILKVLQDSAVFCIQPAEPITLQSKGTTSIEIIFRPRSRVTQFMEEVFLEFAGVYQPLCIVKGSCLGMEVHLCTNSIVFGAVIQLGHSSRRLIMYNTGDMNAKFRWDIKSFAPDYSIVPVEGYITAGKEVLFDVTFHPQEVNSEIKYSNLLCFLKGGQHRPLSLTLYGHCTNVLPIKEVQHFWASVRQKDIRTIPINNRSNSLWELKPVIDGEQWSGNTTLFIEAQETAQYQLVYKPLSMTKQDKKHEGSLFIPLPDGTGLLYYLSGTADLPKPHDRIVRDVPCKMTYTEMIPVKNWLKKPQRFSVKTEIVKADKTEPGIVVKGMDYIDVPANSKKDYRFNFFGFKEGTVILKVVFMNDKSGEYHQFELVFRMTKPDVVSTIELTTACRNACPHIVHLFNPLNHVVTFNVTCNVPEVQMPSNVLVPPETESHMTIEYQPLKVGQVKGRLEFSCPELGVYMYDLVLKATPNAPEKPLYFRVQLGQHTTQVAKFINLTKQRTEFSCKIDCPDFTVVRSIPVTGFGIEATVEVTFEPSKIGEQITKLIVHSTAGGEYCFPLYGSCQPPKPQGPYNVKAGGYTGILFRNVFPTQTQFTFQLDNPLFTLTKTMEKIRPRKDYKILVTFKGNSTGSKTMVTGQLIVTCAMSAGVKHNMQWVYYLKGLNHLDK